MPMLGSSVKNTDLRLRIDSIKIRKFAFDAPNQTMAFPSKIAESSSIWTSMCPIGQVGVHFGRGHQTTWQSTIWDSSL